MGGLRAPAIGAFERRRPLASTGMAKEAAMAKIGIGRDAADVAFLTAYGEAVLNSQSVSVRSADN